MTKFAGTVVIDNWSGPFEDTLELWNVFIGNIPGQFLKKDYPSRRRDYYIKPRGRHERYPGTYGYRVLRKFQNLGTAGYWVSRKFKNLGTAGYQAQARKIFFGYRWVPGTGQIENYGYRPNFFSCRPLHQTIIIQN